MPKPARGHRLGSGPAHERAILRNLSRSLIVEGRIVTTQTKAKRLRPVVEKLLTKARKGGLHRRRQVLSELQDRKIVHKLFEEVAPRTGERPGGYTRILKLGQRRGDATPMAIIEFVDFVPAAPHADEASEEKPRRRLRRRKSEGSDDDEVQDAEDTVADEAIEASDEEAEAPQGAEAPKQRTEDGETEPEPVPVGADDETS